ncbi:MAG: hypothetical protein HYY04_07460 [Chloroflexi bacterium]|nr:hypothetical protein [Chloroflexota bacterium]
MAAPAASAEAERLTARETAAPQIADELAALGVLRALERGELTVDQALRQIEMLRGRRTETGE